MSQQCHLLPEQLKWARIARPNDVRRLVVRQDRPHLPDLSLLADFKSQRRRLFHQIQYNGHVQRCLYYVPRYLQDFGLGHQLARAG